MKSFLLSLFLATWAGAVLAAPLPDPRRAPAEAREPTFDDLMERIRTIAAGNDWQKPGWKDTVVEGSLTKLIDQLSNITKRKDLVLPVDFGDVQPGKNVGRPNNVIVNGGVILAGNPTVQNALAVLKGNPSLGIIRKSIVLVDGSLRGSLVEDSVIIARGAVEISGSRRSVILAGQYLHVSYESTLVVQGFVAPGVPQQQPVPGPNILLSGDVMDLNTVRDSICSAPTLMKVTYADGTTFINSPEVKVTSDRKSVRIADANFNLAPRSRKSPLQNRLKISEAVKGDRVKNRSFVVVDHGGGLETVLRPGAPIADRQGQPVAELAGWNLSFVADQYALFAKGAEFAGVVLDASARK